MTINCIAIIGTGIMGMGIAQISAQAGIDVKLFDAKPQAAEQTKSTLAATLQKLLDKGKLTQDQYAQTLQRLIVVETIEDVADADVVVEAIIENLDIKQKLFAQLEAIVAPTAILASNTSSLSITSIAANCQHPERVAGFHFFNPVPLMKIVEVIGGLSTNQTTLTTLLDLAKRIGHLGVIAKDTPGFIVNHAGRAYGTEALKILGEQVATVSDIDRIMREGAGFRMGPFELFDLTALDVSHPVMESIFNQYYQEPRYRPHPLTRQMLAGKKVGRKVGEGFYKYDNGKKTNETAMRAIPTLPASQITAPVWVGADDADDKQKLHDYFSQNNISIDTQDTPSADSIIILATYGEDTTAAALRYQVDAKRCVAIDMLTDFGRHRTLMPSIITDEAICQQAMVLFSHFASQENATSANAGVTVIQESVGFVAQRILAMVVNLACDMAGQGIADVHDIDNAVRLGLGYPYGPISWGETLGAKKILLILERIYAITGDSRYRPSAWLQRRAKLGVSLFHQQPVM